MEEDCGEGKGKEVAEREVKAEFVLFSLSHFRVVLWRRERRKEKGRGKGNTDGQVDGLMDK